MAGPAYIWDEWRFEPTECRLMRDEVIVPMPAKTLDLLATLLRRAPRLVTKEEILAAVWPDAAVEEGNIAFHIAALRKTLDAGDGPSAIETVRGRGYRFVQDVAILQLPPTDAVQQRIVEPPSPVPSQPPVAPSPPPRRRTRWWTLAAAAILVAALVVTAVVQWRPAEWSVVVMPFTVVDSVEGAALVPGLAQYIVLELETSGIRAHALTSGPGGEQPRDTGSSAGAASVLTGTLQRSSGGWRVSVQMDRASDGRREWNWVFDVSEDEQRPTVGEDDLRSRIQGLIAEHLAAGLQRRLAAGLN